MSGISFRLGCKCDRSWIAWRANHVPHEDGFCTTSFLFRVLPTCPLASRNWQKACSTRKGRSSLTTEKRKSTRPQGVCCSGSSHAPFRQTRQDNNSCRKPVQYTGKKKKLLHVCASRFWTDPSLQKSERGTPHSSAGQYHGHQRMDTRRCPLGASQQNFPQLKAPSHHHALCKITVPVKRRSVCTRRRNCWT